MTTSSPTIGAAALLAALLTAPASSAQDWDATVKKACEHRRYAMRRAVSKRIADAGDAPVPAIRDYARQNGIDRVPLLLVDALAGAESRGEAVIALLTDWASDREFYWRAQALSGLARREIAELRPMFLAAARDDSWLYRVAGAQGLHLLDPDRDRAVIDGLIEADPDPRLRTRLAGFLFEHGDRRAAGTLVAALQLEADFLGDPWGKREATRAQQLLRAALPDAADAAEFRRDLAAAAADWREPDFSAAPAEFVGGVGIRSCRNGDLFLRWTASGEVFEGLLPNRGVQLEASAWSSLAPGLAELDPGDHQVHGKVVCDYLELVCGEAAHRVKCAPSTSPPALQDWLGKLAGALRATKTPGLADELSGRLRQFSRSEDQ